MRPHLELLLPSAPSERGACGDGDRGPAIERWLPDDLSSRVTFTMNGPEVPFDIAIEVLARAARRDVVRMDIELARGRCGVHTFSEESWLKDFARVGSEIGIRVRPVELSVAELAQGEADELLPLVRLESRLEGTASVTILERTGRRLRVVVNDNPAVLTLDERALASLLNVASNVAVQWATGDSRASLGSERHGEQHHPSPLRRLHSLVKLERDDLGVVVIYAAGVGLLSLATPLGVQFLVNTVAFGALLQPLVVLTLLVLAGLALEGLLRALKSWVIERVQQRIFVRVALDVAFRVPRVRQDVVDERYAPELVNRFFDVVTLQKGAATLLSDGVSILLSALVGMVILAFYHPFLLAFDVTLVVGIAIMVFVLGRNAVVTSVGESAAKYAVAAWLEQAATHRTSFSLGNGPTYVAARAESLTRAWLERRREHWRIVFRQLTSALVLRAVASAALLGLGGWLVLSRQLSLGQLVAAELVVSTVVAGFAKFGKAFEDFYDLVAATDKVGHLVDLELVRSDGVELPSSSGGLAVTAHQLDVGCSGRIVARGVDLHLSPGSRTMIYGKGGVGKSCLVDVLAGLRAPEGGRLVIDDLPTEDLSPADVRSVVAIVRQPEVFQETLFDNIALGRPAVDRRAARAALQAVGLDDFVAGLPEGLDTQLPSRGAVVEANVALLLTVARALAGSARLLILDGALDRFDEADRRALWRAVSERAWTVLVTTSRRDLLDLAETTYELDGERLARTSRGPMRLSRPAIAQAEEA